MIARNGNNREGTQNPLSSPLAGEEAVVCDAKRALQMQVRGAFSRNNKTLSRISKFTSFTKKFNPLPEVEGKCAFTLAEVLITLGIIGVVASLTLPSVINDIKHKQLETAFKSAYSIFSQGFMNMKREDGEGRHRNYAYYDAENHNYPMVTEFKNKFYSYSNIKVIGKCSYKNGSIKNFNKTANVTNNELLIGNIYQANNFDVLSNGMCSKVFINGGRVGLFVDVNGLKAPNQLGHDIFHFYIDDKDVLQPKKMWKLYTEEELAKENYPALAGLPCSIKSKQAGNGIGCTYYALINQNPDDPAKGYWETLP